LGMVAGALGTSVIVRAPALAQGKKESVLATPHRNSPRFELDEVTIRKLQAGMKSGEVTARSITAEYLMRIDEIDKRGPAINSIIEINPEAMAIAKALDEERKAQGPRGPLHGIPVLIKENISTHDRMMTTAGSLALAGSIPARDSFVVTRLREAGAIILAKANLSEWADVRSYQSTSGWSSRGGQTRNPYALDRNPNGSSAGSGAAIAANLGVVALGTETDGSVTCPSSANCLVGIKPTVGLASRRGIVPISHTQDTPGPMARTVTDAVILLCAMSGIDPEDSATAGSRGKAKVDYTPFLDARGLKGARIGVGRKTFAFGEAVDKLLNNAIAAMKEAGAEIIDPADIRTLGQFESAEQVVLHYELKADLNAYLSGLGPGAPVHSLQEVIEFNQKNWKREMPYFGQERFLKSAALGPLSSPEYLEAHEKAHRLTRTEGIDALMDKFHLDAIVAPTAGLPWVTDLVNGDHDTGKSSRPAAVAGYPNLTVPAGFVFGLPAGISFFGRAYSEPTLIKLAYSFEQITQHRRPPKFLPTADLTV